MDFIERNALQRKHGRERNYPGRVFVVERYMESEGDAGLEDGDLLGAGGLMAE